VRPPPSYSSGGGGGGKLRAARVRRGGKGRGGGQRNRKAASSLELLPSSSPSLLSSLWPAPLISLSALCTRFNVSVLDPSVVHVAASEILFSIGIFVRTRS